MGWAYEQVHNGTAQKAGGRQVDFVWSSFTIPLMRVGLPRALLYYRYGKFWECYLRELGCELVLSRKTDKVLLEQGLDYVSSEVCLPIKILAGHVAELASQVDVVFLPRMMWLPGTLFACPKMIGIVDVMRMALSDRIALVAPSVKGDFMYAHFWAGLRLQRNPARVLRALRRARTLLRNETTEPTFPPGEKRVALIGHFYNLQDDFISHHIVSTFRKHGYRVVCKDDLPASVLGSSAGFAAKIRWVYERELYNAFRYLLPRVEGLCAVVSMGCGPDSLIAEFMREESAIQGVPFLQLIIDEHTGVAGLVTRIEAFVELIQRGARSERRASLATGRAACGCGLQQGQVSEVLALHER